MRKKTIWILSLCCVLAVALSLATTRSATAATEDGTGEATLLAAVSYPVPGGFIYFDGNTGEITGCSEGITNVEIPSAIYGVPVTGIGDYAFNGSTVISVTIPEGVTRIGIRTFQLSKLQSIFIPLSLTSIDGWAFEWCYDLTDIYYKGTPAQWFEIDVADNGATEFYSSTMHFAWNESNAPLYHINSVSLSDGATSIPADSFLVTVSVTKLEGAGNHAMVLLVAYAADGKMTDDLMYVSTQGWVTGGTFELTLNMANRGRNIKTVKAFVVNSFHEFTPLSVPVSFPPA